MKEHIISAIVTFVSTFLTTFGALILTIDVNHIDRGAIMAIIISAINVAIRLTIKTTFVLPKETSEK